MDEYSERIMVLARAGQEYLQSLVVNDNSVDKAAGHAKALGAWLEAQGVTTVADAVVITLTIAGMYISGQSKEVEREAAVTVARIGAIDMHRDGIPLSAIRDATLGFFHSAGFKPEDSFTMVTEVMADIPTSDTKH